MNQMNRSGETGAGLPSSQGLGQFLQSAKDTGTPAASNAACACSGSSAELRRTAASRFRRFIVSWRGDRTPSRQGELHKMGMKIHGIFSARNPTRVKPERPGQDKRCAILYVHYRSYK